MNISLAGEANGDYGDFRVHNRCAKEINHSQLTFAFQSTFTYYPVWSPRLCEAGVIINPELQRGKLRLRA